MKPSDSKVEDTRPQSSARDNPSPSLEDCPPTPDSEEELGFEPHQPMVDWYSPRELVRSGVKLLISTVFGSYADSREMQALQAEQKAFDYRGEEPIWFDYVADLGDGFDSTYTVARLLAEDTLELDGEITKRGRLLVMGGDQIYPSATSQLYNDRLIGPYRAALPCVVPEENAPHLFSIPGNHDWYDGLTSYTRLFCQNRWIGGWKTRQSRSYFAVQLSDDWWILGLDIQLTSDLDLPQLRYFQQVASEQMQPGSHIILCNADPTWVQAAEDRTVYDNLAFFKKKVLAPHGHVMEVGLSGHYHTYARFEEQEPAVPDAPKQRFISGGGGAYLYPTHDLPRHLELPGNPPANTQDDGQPPKDEKYSSEKVDDEGNSGVNVFPSISESRANTLGSLLFGFKSWRLSLFLGSFFLFFAWVLNNAGGPGFIGELAEAPTLTGAFVPFMETLLLSPSSTILLLLMWGGFIGFADMKGVARVALGTFHAALHILLFLGLMRLFVGLFPTVLTTGLQLDNLFFVLGIIVVGGLLAGMLMGFYLIITNLIFGIHSNEVYLGQRLTSYKNVIRFRLDTDGTLTIYPIGLRKVCRDWSFDKDAPRGSAWFSSETWDKRYSSTSEKEDRLYELIEGPIQLKVSDSSPAGDVKKEREGSAA